MAVEGRLDHHGTFGHGQGIAEAAGGIGRADQEDQLAGPAQGQAGNGGVAVVEGLESPDDDEIVKFNENTSCRCGSRGSVPWLAADATPMDGPVKPAATLSAERRIACADCAVVLRP